MTNDALVRVAARRATPVSDDVRSEVRHRIAAQRIDDTPACRPETA